MVPSDAVGVGAARPDAAAIASPRDGGPALGGARAGAAHSESHCPRQRSEVLLEADDADDSVTTHQQQVKESNHLEYD